ncbi:hypothetical protein D3C71_1576760 [compost metagenome]
MNPRGHLVCVQTLQNTAKLLQVATRGARAFKEDVVEDGRRSRLAAFGQGEVTQNAAMIGVGQGPVIGLQPTLSIIVQTGDAGVINSDDRYRCGLDRKTKRPESPELIRQSLVSGGAQAKRITEQAPVSKDQVKPYTSQWPLAESFKTFIQNPEHSIAP